MFQFKNNWQPYLEEELKKDYFVALLNTLKKEYETKKVYPEKQNIFRAFDLTSYKDVKVVIIGQDPYHQKGQAHGLSFSVEPGVKTPPSLANIYKELQSDLNCTIPNNGNLEKWARQGVLLLNAVLTVEDSKPNSHKDLGWENFTKQVVMELNKREESIVFLLWGNNAKVFLPLINAKKHFVLTASHPSPFSAYNGFFGCRHFSKANAILKLLKKEPIDWQIENI